MERKIRVVIAKPGLDGHDRGAKIIARALRDAGMEVIYTGLHQTPEQIVETAIQEDADAVGISILSGAHMTLVPRIVEGLRANEADDVLVLVGGTIPADDAAALREGWRRSHLHAGRADGGDRRAFSGAPSPSRRGRAWRRPVRRSLGADAIDRERAGRPRHHLEARLRRSGEDDQAARRPGTESPSGPRADLHGDRLVELRIVRHFELDRVIRNRRPRSSGPDAHRRHRELERARPGRHRHPFSPSVTS